MPDDINPITRPSPREADPEMLSRREALLQILRVGGVAAAAGGAGFWLNSRSKRPIPSSPEQARKDHRIQTSSEWASLAIAQLPADSREPKQGEPSALVQRVFENLGGIGRFIRPQDVVVIKPNIAWDRTPEQAANTNPDLVAEVVRQCRDVGAKRVIVTDVSCNEARRCFHRSGCGVAGRAW